MVEEDGVVYQTRFREPAVPADEVEGAKAILEQLGAVLEPGEPGAPLVGIGVSEATARILLDAARTNLDASIRMQLAANAMSEATRRMLPRPRTPVSFCFAVTAGKKVYKDYELTERLIAKKWLVYHPSGQGANLGVFLEFGVGRRHFQQAEGSDDTYDTKGDDVLLPLPLHRELPAGTIIRVTGKNGGAETYTVLSWLFFEQVPPE